MTATLGELSFGTGDRLPIIGICVSGGALLITATGVAGPYGMEVATGLHAFVISGTDGLPCGMVSSTLDGFHAKPGEPVTVVLPVKLHGIAPNEATVS